MIMIQEMLQEVKYLENRYSHDFDMANREACGPFCIPSISGGGHKSFIVRVLS